jgi:hypothetical protein
MKTKLATLSLLIIVSTHSLFAQMPYTGYIPFPNDSAQWSNVKITPSPNFSLATTQYKMKGDTLINAIEYKKIYTSYDLNYNTMDTLLHCFMRQDTAQKKVFVRYPFASYQDTSEYLLYNFNLHYHDTFQLRLIADGLYHNFVITSEDTVQFNFDFRRNIGVMPIDTCQFGVNNCLWGLGVDGGQSWTEGMGSNLSTFIIELGPGAGDSNAYNMQCFWDHGLYASGGTFCNINTGINDLISSKNLLSVSPNPIIDFAIIDFKNNDIVQLDVFNMMGTLIKKIKLNQEKKYLLSVQDFQNGQYLINATNKKGNTLHTYFSVVK